jgi:hypothetical protein
LGPSHHVEGLGFVAGNSIPVTFSSREHPTILWN